MIPTTPDVDEIFVGIQRMCLEKRIKNDKIGVSRTTALEILKRLPNNFVEK